VVWTPDDRSATEDGFDRRGEGQILRVRTGEIGWAVLSNVVAIAAGYGGLALRGDGTMVSWGPGSPGPLSNVVAIAARGNSYFAVVTNDVELDRKVKGA